MDQKIVLISGLALLGVIVVLSFTVDFESTPSGDAVLFMRRHTGKYIPNCQDSDGGKDYNTQGKVLTKYGYNLDTCVKDDNRYVQEYYCRDGKRGIIQKLCAFGCKHGECQTSGRRLGVPPEGPGVAS